MVVWRAWPVSRTLVLFICVGKWYSPPSYFMHYGVYSGNLQDETMDSGIWVEEVGLGGELGQIAV